MGYAESPAGWAAASRPLAAAEPKPRGLPIGLHSVTIRSVRTKILGIAGVTVGLILWAWAVSVTAQIVWYGFWSTFNTLTGGD